MTRDPEAQLTQTLASLDAAELATVARRYRALARQDGAFVRQADGSEVAIPPVLTPIVLSADERRALSRDAQHLVSAITRVSRALIEGADAPLAALIFSPLSALEHEAMLHTHREAERLATARVDFLVDTTGVARALEVNTTIPAMQGYSDAIAGAFLRALGEQRALSPARIEAAVTANGRNTDDLLGALTALHQATGGAPGGPRSIAIVARAGDSQSGELEHYVRRFAELGVEAFRVTPDHVRLDGDRALADGRPVDLFYRHVFLRRLAPESDFARMLRRPTHHRVFNPPASHLELKSMLGLASAVAADPRSPLGLTLSEEERDAVARRIPWTRVLGRGPTTAPDGAAVADLVAFVLAHPHDLVLKRSWDYGGRGVLLGAELHDPGSQAKLTEMLGARERPYGWRDLVEHIVRAGESWVVQTLVDVAARPLTRVDEDGPSEQVLYTDLSAFTSLGTDVEVGGGAVRASKSRIVNIQGGGGLAPLLRREAIELLF